METKEQNTVTVEVIVKVPNIKGQLESVMSTEGKLTKADAGIESKEQISIHIEPGEDGGYSNATVSVNYSGSSTQVDEGLEI